MSEHPLKAGLAEALELQRQLTAAEAQVAQLRARVAELEDVLDFYGDPETYLAIGFFPDPPCGEFMEDWSDTGEEWGWRPGKRARAALQDAEQ